MFPLLTPSGEADIMGFVKLSGKVVLITGAARRIGRSIALRLAAHGAVIAAHYNTGIREARSLKSEIEKQGGEAHLFQADFSFSGRPLLPVIQKFLKKIYHETRRIDVLINNASIFYPTPFGKIAEKDWDQFLTVNLKAPFLLAQETGKKMLAQKSGKIINLVDWTGDRPYPDFLPYAISKAGLIAATKGLAKALAPYVQVAGIAPGPILPAEKISPSRRQKAVAHSLLKRYGSPEDIAETVRFLIEDTDFITGSILSVDGGASIV